MAECAGIILGERCFRARFLHFESRFGIMEQRALRTASGGAVSLKVAPIWESVGATVMSDEWTDVKAHRAGPKPLAESMASKDLSQRDILEDMRDSPELYYADHVELSRKLGVLPLSGQGWRRSCLMA